MAAIAACRAAPTPPPSSADDAAKKKSTDCVYFLASPLTCKKGAECEFRHSESARINPRDCWFWLSGNCYNRGCPFRHPPLDVARPESGAGAPAAATTPAPPQPASSSKARAPCYYFAQGYCAKGDRCTFLHALAPRPAPALTPAPAPDAVQKPQHQQQHQQQQQPQKKHEPSKPKIEVKTLQRPAAQLRAEASKPAPRKPEVSVTRRPELVPPRQTFVPTRDRASPERINNRSSVVVPREERINNRSSGIVLREEKINNRSSGIVLREERINNRSSGIILREERINNKINTWSSSPEPESSTQELEDEEAQGGRSENGGRDENSPGFDVLVDDGPDEQLHYMDEGEYHLHGEAPDDDDQPFDYHHHHHQERFARRGGGGYGGDYDRRQPHDVFDRVDYDRPRHHDQVDNTLERDYYKKSSSIKDRLVFNGEARSPAAGATHLNSGDLRNVLERRKFKGDHQRMRNDHLHQREQLVQRRFVQRVAPAVERRTSQEPRGVFRGARAEPGRARGMGTLRDSSPPVYERASRGFESSNFAAPKSLAQIRAEKRKSESSPSENGFAKRVQRATTWGTGDDHQQHEFEGPKPLVEILKEKQKVAVVATREAEDDVQGITEPMMSSGWSGANGVEIESSPMADELPENDREDDDPVEGYNDGDGDGEEDDDDFAKKLGKFFS